MPIVYVNYVAHIVVLTGRFRETIELKGETIGDVILELDKKYPRLKDLFIPPEIGKLNIRTMIHVVRTGEPPKLLQI
jgi:molybdopterin converting factor small subunit